MSDVEQIADDVPRIGLAALEPDQELIESLEKLLADARSGHLRGLTYIGLVVGSDVTYGCLGEMVSQKLKTAGLLHWYQMRLVALWDTKWDQPR